MHATLVRGCDDAIARAGARARAYARASVARRGAAPSVEALRAWSAVVDR